jgi:arsenate reductase (thioredoxin)
LKKIKVLFVGTGNSARSQMGEALLRRHAGNRVEACSAGLEPEGIHPYTKRALKEIGINLAGQYSKDLDQYKGKSTFGYLITVCAEAKEKCPADFPGISVHLHWPFENLTAFAGTEEEKLERFREVRDQIDLRLRSWLQEQGISIEE